MGQGGACPWRIPLGWPALRCLVVASPAGVPMADVLRLPWPLVSGPQGSLCAPCPNNLSSCQGVGLATPVSLLALQVPMGALSVVCNLGTPRVLHEALMCTGQAKPTEVEWLLPRSFGGSSPCLNCEVPRCQWGSLLLLNSGSPPKGLAVTVSPVLDSQSYILMLHLFSACSFPGPPNVSLFPCSCD